MHTIHDKREEEDLFINTCPLQGFHLTNSFLNRVWLIIEHIHAVLIIFKYIFGATLVTQKKFPETLDLDKKCLAFLFQCTAECAQRSAFVQVLAQLAIVFPSKKEVVANKNLVSSLVKGSAGGTDFLSTIQSRSGAQERNKVEVIKDCLYEVNNLSTKAFKAYNNDPVKQYKMVRYSVFTHFLKFNQQEILSKKVHGNYSKKQITATKRALSLSDSVAT
jgi:hypothetical protein